MKTGGGETKNEKEEVERGKKETKNDTRGRAAEIRPRAESEILGRSR